MPSLSFSKEQSGQIIIEQKEAITALAETELKEEEGQSKLSFQSRLQKYGIPVRLLLGGFLLRYRYQPDGFSAFFRSNAQRLHQKRSTPSKSARILYAVVLLGLLAALALFVVGITSGAALPIGITAVS